MTGSATSAIPLARRALFAAEVAAGIPHRTAAGEAGWEAINFDLQ